LGQTSIRRGEIKPWGGMEKKNKNNGGVGCRAGGRNKTKKAITEGKKAGEVTTGVNSKKKAGGKKNGRAGKKQTAPLKNESIPKNK